MKNPSIFFITLFLFFYCIASFAQTTLKIEIVGVTGEAKDNIESSLGVESMHEKSPEEIQQFFSSSKDLIKKALEPFGYFKATVQSSLSKQEDTWIARFQITPGRPIRITALDANISGEGVQDPAFQKIITHFPLTKHQIFSVPLYNKTKKELMGTALARGYFDAQFTKTQIRIDLKNYTVQIILHFDTGIRYRFGQLSFNKNPFSTDFLKRFSPFKTSEYYSAEKVQEFQEALTGSNYFKEITVEPNIDRRINHKIPIDVFVKALPEKEYRLGLGYGTDTGIRGLAGFEWRRITPGGQHFETQIQASEINSNLQLNYTIPGKKPATDKYIFTIAMEKNNEILGDSDLQKVMASYVSTLWGWEETAALTFQRERSALEDQPYQTQFLLIPSIRWSKISQDDPLRPSKGSRISLDLLGAPDLFSNSPFLQAQLDAKAIFPVFGKNRLVLRGNLGYTETNSIADLPLSLQFFTGGAQSIRGYSYNSIGPGTNTWLTSVEYRQRIKGDWYAAVFFDAGNVSNNAIRGIKKGIGLGAVWQSPLGTLELTLAQAQDLSGKPLALQFSMGPDL